MLNREAFKLLRLFTEAKTLDYDAIVERIGEDQSKTVVPALLRERYIRSAPYMGENDKIVTSYEITELGVDLFEKRSRKWLTTYGPLVVSMIALIVSVLVAIYVAMS